MSPPDANDILGISCLAISCPVSKLLRVKLELLMFKFTFDPACSILGLSEMARTTFLSTYNNNNNNISQF